MLFQFNPTGVPDTLSSASSGSQTFPDAVGTLKPNQAATVKRLKRDPLEPLIVDGLRAAGHRGLILADIYRHVIERGAKYSDGVEDGRRGVAWRKNVRHILTVRDFFVKTGVRNPDGRGQFWRFDERKYDEFQKSKRKPVAMSAAMSVTGPSCSATGNYGVENSATARFTGRQDIGCQVFIVRILLRLHVLFLFFWLTVYFLMKLLFSRVFISNIIRNVHGRFHPSNCFHNANLGIQ